jgi:sRNA-binding carbon storage regulator CsrA
MIGDNIIINVVEVQGENVRIAIDAPRDIKIYRGEISCDTRGKSKGGSRAERRFARCIAAELKTARVTKHHKGVFYHGRETKRKLHCGGHLRIDPQAKSQRE